MCGNCSGSNLAGNHPDHFCNGWGNCFKDFNFVTDKSYGNKNNSFQLNNDLSVSEKEELELLRKEVALYREIINPDYLKNDLYMRGFYSGRDSVITEMEDSEMSVAELAEEYWIQDREDLIQSELSKLEKGDDF